VKPTGMSIHIESSTGPASSSKTCALGFGEPVSEHAAGGAGTDDDVVVVRHASLPLCLRPAKRLRGFSLLGRDYRQDDMRKAGRLRGAAVASVARLYSSVRCVVPRPSSGSVQEQRCFDAAVFEGGRPTLAIGEKLPFALTYHVMVALKPRLRRGD